MKPVITLPAAAKKIEERFYRIKEMRRQSDQDASPWILLYDSTKNYFDPGPEAELMRLRYECGERVKYSCTLLDTRKDYYFYYRASILNYACCLAIQIGLIKI